MKRRTILLILICTILIVAAGCSREDPYRVDTVVRIPVDPTQAAPTETVPAETIPEETEMPAEATEPTEETEVPETTGRKSAGGKGSSGKGSSGSKQSSGSGRKETQPPETQPPATNPPETEPPYNPSDYSPGSLEYAILQQLNAYREAEGLQELSLSGKLSGIAGLRAREACRLWSHTRPDGRDYTSAMDDYGYGYGCSAENLAQDTGSGDAASIVEGWMANANADSILSGSYSTVGIGVYRSGGTVCVAAILVG